MSSFLQEVKGFTPVIDIAVADVGFVTAGVYGVAWRYCQMSERVCKASQEKIAAHLGISAKTVQRHLRELCSAGYLKDTTPHVRNRPHIYVDTGKVIIAGLVEARLAVGQRVQPGMTESLGGPDRESVEDSIDDSSYELPARQPAQGTDYFTASDEPEYVDIEEEEGSGKKRPKWQIPETTFQRNFLSVCGAKRFKSKQKTLVKKLAKCLDIGATLSEAACLQRCLDELQGCENFPERPLAIPNSWLCWRSDHAKSNRWSVQGFINSLFDRDALVRHCQVGLKKMGVAPSAADIAVPEGMVRLLTEDGVKFITQEEAEAMTQ